MCLPLLKQFDTHLDYSGTDTTREEWCFGWMDLVRLGLMSGIIDGILMRFYTQLYLSHTYLFKRDLKMITKISGFVYLVWRNKDNNIAVCCWATAVLGVLVLDRFKRWRAWPADLYFRPAWSLQVGAKHNNTESFCKIIVSGFQNRVPQSVGSEIANILLNTSGVIILIWYETVWTNANICRFWTSLCCSFTVTNKARLGSQKKFWIMTYLLVGG